MAKDTEKLIRQLSLISFLMAQRRPASALEIKSEVEGYSEMNDDAFARRFYADRSELDSLGIELQVEKPSEGYFEQELYTLPPENFHLPAIEFSDPELAALQTALSLLDGQFAYAEPLRLALQQISWGRPSPLTEPEQTTVALAVTAAAGGRDLSQRLSKLETAIERRKTVEFTYHTMERDHVEKRKVDPYMLLFRGGQFYAIGHSHERQAIRVFRLSRIQGKVSYATKAEHDFHRPEDFERETYKDRWDWQLGELSSTAQVWVSERIAWLAERQVGHYGTTRAAGRGEGGPGKGVVFETEVALPRALVSWVLGLQERARVLGPPELVEEAGRRIELVVERHTGKPELAPKARRRARRGAADEDEELGGRRETPTPIRPERFARLVTLATLLISAAREQRRIDVGELCDGLQLTEAELQEDLNVLNVVNFGAGSYVLYAQIEHGQVEVDQESYGDNFARPARLLPLEAKALVAAIDLLGEHLPEGSLRSARAKIVEALGEDPAEKGLQIVHVATDDSDIAQVCAQASKQRRLLGIEYYKEDTDEFSKRLVEPYGIFNSSEGWYVLAYDPGREGQRHFRLDRIKEARIEGAEFEPRPEIDLTADIEGWPRTGEVSTSNVARLWISPERAARAREDRTVVDELTDGAVIVELPYAGAGWLVREVLKEAGDAAVLEPAEARAAVLEAARRLQAAASGQGRSGTRAKAAPKAKAKAQPKRRRPARTAA